MNKEITIEIATAWLKQNSELLNFSQIARRINTDIGTFNRSVYGLNDIKDRKVKIPKRCLPELVKIMEELNTHV